MKRDPQKARDWQERSARRAEENRRRKVRRENDETHREVRAKVKNFECNKRRKRRMRAQSTTQKQRLAAYEPVRLTQLENVPLCEVEGCAKIATQVHHKRGRTGPNLFLHLMSVCHQCHVEIHRNPARSHELGYMISRHGEN
jgi:hypothetical protein